MGFDYSVMCSSSNLDPPCQYTLNVVNILFIASSMLCVKDQHYEQGSGGEEMAGKIKVTASRPIVTFFSTWYRIY